MTRSLGTATLSITQPTNREQTTPISGTLITGSLKGELLGLIIVISLLIIGVATLLSVT